MIVYTFKPAALPIAFHASTPHQVLKFVYLLRYFKLDLTGLNK